MTSLLFGFAQISTENTKRVLFIVFLLLIIVLAFLSFIGYLILRLINHQGRMLDRHISDPIRKCRIIKDQKHFVKYASKKNKVLFFHEAFPPMCILLGATLLLIIYYAISDNWGYNPWNMDTGFGSLLITWDFSTILRINPDGYKGVLINWPQVSHSPSFDIRNWCGYLVGTAYLVGGLWYLYTVQGYVARFFRILRLRRTMFDKSLDDFNVEKDSLDTTKAQ